MYLQIKRAIRKLFSRKIRFKNSKDYWNKRYLEGGNSGSGSYGRLAEFKAEVLNDFVNSNNIETVIEFGCGDGNQLKYMNYPTYVGFDVSVIAIEGCQTIFQNDNTRRFKLMCEYSCDQADLTISLEVIFHLIEDDVYHEYMCKLFSSSRGYVIIYSSNTDENKEGQAIHVKHRKFTKWIEENKVPFQFVKKIKNQHPFNGSNDSSFSDFYFYERKY